MNETGFAHGRRPAALQLSPQLALVCVENPGTLTSEDTIAVPRECCGERIGGAGAGCGTKALIRSLMLIECIAHDPIGWMLRQEGGNAVVRQNGVEGTALGCDGGGQSFDGFDREKVEQRRCGYKVCSR